MGENKVEIDFFKEQNPLEFLNRFNINLALKEYIAQIKRGVGYWCSKHGHGKYKVSRYLPSIFIDIESPSTDLLCHQVKSGLRKAFFICFETSSTTKSLSAIYIIVRYKISANIVRLFMQKVPEVMQHTGDHPISSDVHVDEIVVGKANGKVVRKYSSKKKKLACTVQPIKEGQTLLRFGIRDLSPHSRRGIFDNHISKDAHVTTSSAI